MGYPVSFDLSASCEWKPTSKISSSFPGTSLTAFQIIVNWACPLFYMYIDSVSVTSYKFVIKVCHEVGICSCVSTAIQVQSPKYILLHLKCLVKKILKAAYNCNNFQCCLFYLLGQGWLEHHEGFHTRAKCESLIIIWVMDHSNDGILSHVYAN